MKIKNNIDLDILLKYGFTKIDKEEAFLEEQYIHCQFDYVFDIGSSRRGQYYYLFVNNKNRIIHTYASKPDGSGSYIQLPNVLFKMFLDQIIEL